MISDDDLLLYHYRDGLDAAERARIGAAITTDPQLAQRLQGLVARLDVAAAMPEVPVPEAVQQRWQAALEREAQNDEKRDAARVPRAGRFFSNLQWSAAAAAAAVLAVVVTLQLTSRPSPPQTAEVAPPADASAYERGLKFHLASTERQLAGLDSAKPEERARLIETIISQNRIYALAAERAGEPQLARVLRAFAPILEGLAHDGGDDSANIAQLSFELRVMQGRLSADAGATSKQTTTL
jgi:anti-sigma-K factor RskA